MHSTQYIVSTQNTFCSSTLHSEHKHKHCKRKPEPESTYAYLSSSESIPSNSHSERCTTDEKRRTANGEQGMLVCPLTLALDAEVGADWRRGLGVWCSVLGAWCWFRIPTSSSLSPSYYYFAQLWLWLVSCFLLFSDLLNLN